jgi:cysteine-rich repeat protein
MTCTAVLDLGGNVCGDGDMAGPELCDDGNTITEAKCAYNTANCNVCSDTCTLVARTGDVCGDGMVNAPFEACDDKNTDACGSCSADCQTEQLAAAATGLIVTPGGADLGDGNTFTIDDGLGETVTFEFDKDMMSTMANVAITIVDGDTAVQVANAIRTAITDSDLQITAANTMSAAIPLTHQVQTLLGNQTISESPMLPMSFFTSGMSGGAAGDCTNGTGCTDDADCASGNCASQVCASP